MTDKQLEKVVLDEGNRISTAAQKALGGQLKKAIGEGGPQHAVQFCNLAAYQILDTLTTGLNVRIKRTSLRLRNPKNAPDDTEKKILDSYQNLLNNKTKLQPKVEHLGQNQLLYAKPILLNNPLCLNCHGIVGSQLGNETYNLIKGLYPNDNAVNHKLGELRGIWSITFNKEDIIRYLNQSH